MKILALNSGSSSVKYKVLDSDLQFAEIDDYSEIDAVGHRIVHGGDKFTTPVLITKKVLKEIQALAHFSPLHMSGIEMIQEMLPNVPQVAVFDTCLHATMPPKAFLYGLPLKYYKKYKIRKYGFHGINHAYVAEEAEKLLKRPLKLISCHLGSGCSINAFDKGVSIDNSMGFTPLEGLVMGTRSGDLDPAVVLYLQEKGVKNIGELLNKKSGLLGLCGKSDMQEILADPKAETALEVFVYRVQKYIGAFVAALNGMDAIVFTGGIGENSPEIRARVMKNFTYLGARVDSDKNNKNALIFSKPGTLPLLTIPANEELAIAKQTYWSIKHAKNLPRSAR